MDINKADIKEWCVLVVDDEPDNREVAKRLFSMFGAEVHTANNGEDALDRLEELTPTVILLDLSMPIMDGWEMFYTMRNECRAPLTNVPVIALTAHAMNGDETRVKNAGFDGYIPKPFNSKSLLEDVYTLVENHDAASQADEEPHEGENDDAHEEQNVHEEERQPGTPHIGVRSEN
jgi:CheY-like chemotaxis protein